MPGHGMVFRVLYLRIGALILPVVGVERLSRLLDVDLDRFDLILDPFQAESLVIYRCPVDIFLLAVSLNLFATLAHFDQTKGGR